jgi:hypothetical protein
LTGLNENPYEDSNNFIIDIDWGNDIGINYTNINTFYDSLMDKSYYYANNPVNITPLSKEGLLYTIFSQNITYCNT